MTYSSSLAIGRQRFATSQQNTTTIRTKDRTLGPVSNTIMLVILACLLGLLYLTQVTKTNALSYKINDLRNQQSQLKSEHNDLEISAARLQSLERVKNSQAAQGMTSMPASDSLQN